MINAEILLRDYMQESKKIRLMLFKLLKEHEKNDTLKFFDEDYKNFYEKYKGKYQID